MPRFPARAQLRALLCAALVGVCIPRSTRAAEQAAPRPPQYVLLAFDGSLNLDMWRDTLAFADANEVRFTYFVSGVYFLLDGKRHLYSEPTHGPGRSAIGFGGEKPEEILERVDWVNKADAAGHEIASHANGHYDGSGWTLEQWQHEFGAFDDLLFNVYTNNQLPGGTVPATAYRFDRAGIRGFRAPLLGHNPAMYAVLSASGFGYDASKTAAPGYWPERQNGIWNFPLAELRIAGTGKRTLSMDYNFYFAQSGGKPEPEREREFRDEMVRTYLAYFAATYTGNRAPVHIGHHFSQWNGGAYWKAMQEFAKAVCRLPEVRCTTYRELQSFLEALPESTLSAYRRGSFEKSEFPEAAAALARAEAGVEADLVVTASGKSTVVRAGVVGPHAATLSPAAGATTTFALDGKTLAVGTRQSVDLAGHRKAITDESRLTVTVHRNGKEILKATHGIRKTGKGFVVSEKPEEARAIEGLHPEAHPQETSRNADASTPERR